MVVGRQYTTNAGLNPVQGDGFFQGYNYNVITTFLENIELTRCFEVF